MESMISWWPCGERGDVDWNLNITNAAEPGNEWEFVSDVSFVLVPPHYWGSAAFCVSDEEGKGTLQIVFR